MKNKLITIILSILLVASVGANVFQYMSTSKATDNLSVLTNTKEELASEIETKTTELNSLTSDIEALNAKILELTDSVDSLTNTNNDIKSKIDTDSTGSNVELGEDEYHRDDVLDDIENGQIGNKTSEEIAQEIIADFLKEHAENNTIHVEVEGATPGDPSKDGTIDFDRPSDPALAGDYIK